MSGYRMQDEEKKATFGGEDKEKRQRAMKIMDALSGVDEELLERCGQDRQEMHNVYHRTLWQRTRAWAAVLCFAVVGAASFGGYRLMQAGEKSSSLNGDAAPGEAAFYSSEMAEGAMSEEAAEEEQEEAVPQDTMGTEEYGADKQESESAGQRQDSINETEKENGQMSGGAAANIDGGVDTEGVEQECAEEDTMDKAMMMQAQKLSEAQARDTELGGYIPTALPKGYELESASRNLDRQEANLTLCWTSGMDSILWSIVKTDSVPATVDIARAEAYDERLYEIPYGETVPREYWESFQDPVFAIEDLSLEIIRSRMSSHSDSGDTGTPRGNFRVLYPDGVLVRFNGRGTPEEIWEMFCSIGE